MMTNVGIPAQELSAFGPTRTFADQAHALIRQQTANFPLAQNGYATLATAQTRTFEFDGFVLKLQFNPGRLASSAAKVDPKSIAERKCFLCPAHLPPGQRGLAFERDYLLLVNPFPIFPEHFTIPHTGHAPQRIAGSFDAMLRLAREMSPRYTTFYNGPRAGASAPDHLHFQAGTAGFMPIDGEYDAVKRSLGQTLMETSRLRAYAVADYLRRFVSFESSDAGVLRQAFDAFYRGAAPLLPGDDEPMMNVLASFADGAWRVVVFPRMKHRPSFYTADGDAKILLSPAGVEFGGVCTTPVERDFHRVTREHLVQMFDEVSVAPAVFAQLVTALRATLPSVLHD
jgi:hypothetical protein